MSNRWAGSSEHLGGQLLQRRDVAGPERAAVGPEDEIVLARMDRQIVHRDRRQVRLQPRPHAAAIDRDEHADVVADDEQIADSSGPARRR